MNQLLLAAMWTLGQASEAPDFYHDFRSQPLADKFTVYQAKDENWVKVDPEGLRITLPREPIHAFGGAGERRTFCIRGDFKITAAFEIIQAEVSKTGYGVRPTLCVRKADPSRESSQVGRLVPAHGNQRV